MPKLLNWFDKHFLEFGTAFLLIFIPLYPKLPLFNVEHTWVYIRFEDILVALVVGFWLVQLFRRKASLKIPLAWPIFLYWLVGGLSLAFSLLFLKDQLLNFFPSIAFFHYFRRLEYLLVFFVAFSSVKNLRTVKKYFFVLGLVVLVVCLYGFGQRVLGWPAFLTMNEEFAKGLPLRLGSANRISSTFAGHYDLAAWLVVMIGLFGSLIFGLKKRLWQAAAFFVALSGFFLLLLTASRISFLAYLLAISLVLFLQKKKWLIIPVVLVSFLLMSYFSGASERFGKTFRVERVVYDLKTGQPIAALEKESRIGEVITEQEEIAKENLPLGTGYLPLRGAPEATKVAVIKKPILTSLKTATKASEIATVSGEFLIRRTLVYDISFTTRFQGTWPRAFEALKRNWLLGSGYSSISLATDNSYFRALGETGFLGLAAFLTILFSFFLLAKQALGKISSSFARSVIIGSASALAGLMFNAILIDVFEASKVAFTLWLVLGITVAVIGLFLPKRRSLIKEALEVIRLPFFPLGLLLVVAPLVFYSSFKNYFVGDDFTWLRWAATAKIADIPQFFLRAEGFFYRPLAKIYYLLVYPFLGMRPVGYHLFDFGLHLGVTLGAYFIGLRLTKNKLISFLAALFFLIHPLNAEPVFWISSTSILLANFFYLGGFLSYLFWRQKSKSWQIIFYLFAFLAFLFGLGSHELAVTFPFLLIVYDFLFMPRAKFKNWRKRLVDYLPFIFLTGLYFWLRNGVAGAHGLSGDYNYNWRNLAFNLAGNFFGYFGETLASFRFLALYDEARNYLRFHKFLALSFVFGGFLVLIGILKKFKPNKTIIFLIAWAVILLAPFLGLGNIAERYLYLAKFGFIMLILLIFKGFFERLEKRKRNLAKVLAVLGIGSLLIFYTTQMEKAKQEWYQAGEIANQILLALSSNYEEFPPQTTLYFLNLPIRHGRAWVFPVGLKDGLWFIYRDESLTIQKPTDLEKTLDLAAGKPTQHIFLYDEDGLKEVSR